MEKLQGFHAYSAFHWVDLTLAEKRKNWANMTNEEKQRWERIAGWINRHKDEARSQGYEQGERGGESRMRVRPGDGDMGG